MSLQCRREAMKKRGPYCKMPQLHNNLTKQENNKLKKYLSDKSLSMILKSFSQRS